ncbi:MAG: 30S ribosomal protein S2 [Planctomycetota bacterium]
MSVVELLSSGVHFGHRVSRWNPKMQRYIFGKRNLIHIIDLKETIKGLVRASRFVTSLVARGEDVLFVGTKRQARLTIEAEAQRCGMPYVCERWLGGTLTNFRTVRNRLRRLQEIENLETTGEIGQYSKKMVARFTHEKRKITRNLAGIREMAQLPGALFLIDPRQEYNAVREARKLEIPVIALIDTDSSPEAIDIPIPGNDDAMRSVVVITRRIADAALEGKSRRAGLFVMTEKASQAPQPAVGATPPAAPATTTGTAAPASSQQTA